LDESQAVRALIRRCLAGDAAAWEEIVRGNTRRIYNLCLRFTGSATDAEDLTQEVFIKIYRTLATYDLEKGSFITWTSTITRNLLVDHFRKGKQGRITESLDATPAEDEEGPTRGEQIADTAPRPDAGIETAEKRQMIQKALEKLSPELREAVILRDLQDLDYREIAQVLRVPEGTVKSRINRGRTELGRLLSRTYR
jgi:RNA polymerase sigma-70 factor (ECF subfamily)